MDVRIVYLVNEFEFKKGDIRLVGTELAQQLTKSGKACYYADFTTKMLEDLEGDSEEKAESLPKKKALKKD